MEIDIQQITTLNDKQFKALEEALKSAFPSFNHLKRMYRYTFGKNLDLANSETLVYDIIEQAEANGKLNQLIKGAFKENPENPKLNDFVSSVKTQSADSKQDSTTKSFAKNFKYFYPSVQIIDITSDHIMDIRAKGCKDFYFDRDFDAELLDLALEGENILLLGNSLAGKTRATFELIKKIALQYPDTNIIFPKNIPIKKGTIKIPVKEDCKNIAFIEDIDDHYKNDKNVKKRYDAMIKALVRARVQIFATCRTGPEYKEFKRISTSKVREVFKKIMVGKVKREVVLRFDESIIGNIDQSEFDGNIGSIFMDIQKMKDRYTDLHNADTEEAEVAIKIMRALKTFYFASNFTRKSAYDAEAIKDYCLRLCVSKNASPNKLFNNTIAEQFGNQEKIKLSKEIEGFGKILNAALLLLESDEDNLNFIRQVSNRLEVEEVYLEKIVKYSPFKLIKDIDRLYDALGEKKKNGFYVKTNNYNKLLKDLSYYAAKNLFYEMRRKGVVPNADSYSFLIEKSDTYETALDWYKKLKRYKIPANESVLMALISKANEFDQAIEYAEQLLDLLNSNGEIEANIDYQYLHLTVIVLNLEREITKNQVEQYLDAFLDRFIPISSAVFNKTIGRKIKDIPDVKFYLKWIQLYQIDINKATVNILLGKSSSLQEALNILNEELFDTITIDEDIIVTLIQKSDSLKEALNLIQDEKFKTITTNESILVSLIHKAESSKQALDLLENEIFNNFVTGENTLISLIQKSNSLKEALDIIKNKKFDSFIFNESILIKLIQKSNSLEEALDLLKNENFDNFVVNENILILLIQKSNSLEEALGLFENEKFNTITAEERILINLIKKSKFLKEVINIIESEKFINIKVSESILNISIDKCNSLEQALSLYENEKFKAIPAGQSTLNLLIEKCDSLEEVFQLHENEPFKDIPFNEGTLHILIQKSDSLEEALKLMTNKNFSSFIFNENILTRLIQKSNSLQEAFELLENEKFKNISLSGKVLIGLIQTTTTLQEALDLLDNKKYNSIEISVGILNHIIDKSTTLQEALDLLENEKFKSITLNSSIFNVILQKSESLQEALMLIKNEKFKTINVSESILTTLFRKSHSTKDVKTIIDLINTSKINVNPSFFFYVSNRLSYYRDLSSIPYFWGNYKLFPEFDFWDYSFLNFEQTVSFYKNLKYPMSKISWNHMIFNLLDKLLIKNERQKDEITEWFESEKMFVYDKLERQIKWDVHIYPDIKEMWDNYKLPND